MNLPLAVPVRYCPDKETLAVLNERPWVCSFSGGKDSTTLVTWIEYLRRVGMVRVAEPRLVMSDTGVEYPFLSAVAAELMDALRQCGWVCDIVRPPVEHRLYVRIFGIGNTPVHPGGRKMRWCTRATKIDPMRRYAAGLAPGVVQLSGVRFGESKSRDDKLKPQGCAAGGECGLPEPQAEANVYGPIINWTLCKVVEWIAGKDGQVAEVVADLLPAMRRLHDVYDVRTARQVDLFGAPPAVTAGRFGCIGCPAISNEKITKSKAGQADERWRHLRRIYDVWDQCYAYRNRAVRVKDGAARAGPLRMESRRRLFAELLAIQEAAGVVLVTPEEEAFIRRCWDEKRYPRGWSEADEATREPQGPLFDEVTP